MGGFESGTSVFDPVLTELSYRWFCPPSGQVLDPFAGGSVRGVVASKLGLRYCGIDLSEKQVLANRRQSDVLCADNSPDWRVGDSSNIVELSGKMRADLLFSCPPYGSLERYSDDPRDLSTMKYEEFIEQYRAIISQSIKCLHNDRFAIFVVGDFRDVDSNGCLRHFVGDTVRAFEKAGAGLYNSAINLTPLGTAPFRANRYLVHSRKLAMCHQHWLCFVKGSWKRATEACGDLLDHRLEDNQRQLDIALFGKGLLSDVAYTTNKSGDLSKRFLVPPFSVFDARDGWWRSRKTAWIGLGIESEVGREGVKAYHHISGSQLNKDYDSPKILKEKERRRLFNR